MASIQGIAKILAHVEDVLGAHPTLLLHNLLDEGLAFAACIQLAVAASPSPVDRHLEDDPEDRVLRGRLRHRREATQQGRLDEVLADLVRGEDEERGGAFSILDTYTTLISISLVVGVFLDEA